MTFLSPTGGEGWVRGRSDRVRFIQRVGCWSHAGLCQKESGQLAAGLGPKCAGFRQPQDFSRCWGVGAVPDLAQALELNVELGRGGSGLGVVRGAAAK